MGTAVGPRVHAEHRDRAGVGAQQAEQRRGWWSTCRRRWARGSRAPPPRRRVRSRPSSARVAPKRLDQVVDVDDGVGHAPTLHNASVFPEYCYTSHHVSCVTSAPRHRGRRHGGGRPLRRADGRGADRRRPPPPAVPRLRGPRGRRRRPDDRGRAGRDPRGEPGGGLGCGELPGPDRVPAPRARARLPQGRLRRRRRRLARRDDAQGPDVRADDDGARRRPGRAWARARRPPTGCG